MRLLPSVLWDVYITTQYYSYSKDKNEFTHSDAYMDSLIHIRKKMEGIKSKISPNKESSLPLELQAMYTHKLNFQYVEVRSIGHPLINIVGENNISIEIT